MVVGPEELLASRCAVLLESARKFEKGMKERQFNKPLGLGAAFAAYRELMSALSSLNLEKDSTYSERAQEAHGILKGLIENYGRKLSVPLQLELEENLTRLETFIDLVSTNDDYDNAEMLFLRSSIFELEVLAKELNLGIQKHLERVKRLDHRLRQSSSILIESGIVVAPFWIENAPKEYWWWRLDRDSASTSQQ